ncbi:hypothetical protein IC608_05280 [Devosia sp. PTR5]|uniref:Uncharacterized protein n=1 Tax=Devosia oryzisoli TaxID=2774138 RepID=A0A927FT26_9HYPH|nr:hypothetical protein [Devosia oryzisoli]MBD8064887.1 hypothetical protein [Devosia oryzisoli]
MANHDQKSKPAPLETNEGDQQDDNLDDRGRRPDGSEQDQPVDPAPERKSGSHE